MKKCFMAYGVICFSKVNETGKYFSFWGVVNILVNESLIGEYGTTLRGPKVGPLFQSNVIGPS